jgi:hypothetical protein
MIPLIILVVLLIITLFLLIKFFKANNHFNSEILKLNTNINEINNLLLLQNKKQEIQTNNKSNVESMINDDSINSLKSEYKDYVFKNNFNDSDTLTNELKNKINKLTHFDDNEELLNNNSGDVNEIIQNFKEYNNIEENQLVDEENQLVDEENQLVDEENQLVDEENQLVDEENQLVDEETQLVDEENQLLDEENQLVDEENQLVDEENQLVDEENQLVDEENQLVDEENQLVDEETQLVDEENQLVDEENQLVDEENQLVDEENQLVDEENKSKNIEINTNYNQYSLKDINSLTIKQLQDIARQNNLKIKGRKDELVQRVKALYNLNINLS